MKKIVITTDKELLSEIGDPKLFLDNLEREVWSLFSKGYSTFAIAKRLRITEEAVEFFIKKEREKQEKFREILSLFEP